MTDETPQPNGQDPPRPRIWFRFRRLDMVGAIGAIILIPQVIDRFVNGAASDPALAGIGATLVLAAGGGPRVVDAVARRWGRAE